MLMTVSMVISMKRMNSRNRKGRDRLLIWRWRWAKGKEGIMVSSLLMIY